MTTTVDANNSSGFKVTADTSGILQLQTNGTAAVTIDTSQNVGVGTTPSYKLDVNSLSASNVIGRFTNNSGYYTYLLSSGATSVFSADTSGNNSFTVRGASNQLELYTNGSLRSTLDSSGNLGLGVTPSAWDTSYKAIQVVNAVYAGNALSSQVGHNWYYNGGTKYIANAYATNYYQYNGQHVWQTAASGTSGNAITFTQAMTLDASSNLSVGTTSNLLSATNRVTATINGTSSSAIAFGVGGTRTAHIYSDTAELAIANGNGASGFIDFQTNGTERARIDSSGNLLVGTTSQGTIGSNSSFGAYSSGYIGVSSTGDSAFSRRSSDGAVITLRRDTTSVGAINVTTTSTAYVTSSDYRLKNTIAPMTGALAKVAQLKPVTYKWNADGSDGEGFIAHELAEVCPHAVSGQKDAVDADGNPKYQGIDTSFLVATLTAAIKEQQALITQLQADVAALKGASA